MAQTTLLIVSIGVISQSAYMHLSKRKKTEFVLLLMMYTKDFFFFFFASLGHVFWGMYQFVTHWEQDHLFLLEDSSLDWWQIYYWKSIIAYKILEEICKSKDLDLFSILLLKLFTYTETELLSQVFDAVVIYRKLAWAHEQIKSALCVAVRFVIFSGR